MLSDITNYSGCGVRGQNFLGAQHSQLVAVIEWNTADSSQMAETTKILCTLALHRQCQPWWHPSADDRNAAVGPQQSKPTSSPSCHTYPSLSDCDNSWPSVTQRHI